MPRSFEKPIEGMPPLPRLDAYYWVTLLAACSMGETSGDLISHELGWGYARASAFLGALFVGAMILEFRRIGPFIARYWLGIVVTSTVGTTLADLTTRTLGFGYFLGSALLIVLFAVIFATWRRRAAGEHLTHYWSAVLVASTMGTTLGDFVSNETPLGFGGSSVLLASLLATVFLLGRFSGAPRMLIYWAALVLTSTFGAASGDFLTKEEGLNFGAMRGTAVLALVLVVVAGVSTFVGRRRSLPGEPP